MKRSGKPILKSIKSFQNIKCKNINVYNVHKILILLSNNMDLTLSQFKKIYYMEHYHRVYGRLLGLSIIGPSIFFCLKNWVSPRNKKFLVVSSILVVFQVIKWKNLIGLLFYF